jgi:hypothetical protein
MSRRARILTGGTAVFLIVGLGVAIAAWLVSGSGNGAAKAGELTTINVAAGTPTGDLYPGGSGALELSVTNPNTLPLVITSVSANGAITSDDGLCAGTNVTFTGVTGLSTALPVGGPTAVSLPGAVTMVVNADNACQGATFTIPVTVNAETP